MACGVCNGQGQVYDQVRCTTCGGSGSHAGSTCSWCQGTGGRSGLATCTWCGGTGGIDAVPSYSDAGSYRAGSDHGDIGRGLLVVGLLFVTGVVGIVFGEALGIIAPKGQHSGELRGWVHFAFGVFLAPIIPVGVNALRPGVLPAALRILAWTVAIVAVLISLQLIYFQMSGSSLIHVLRETVLPLIAPLRGIISLPTLLSALLPHTMTTLAPLFAYTLLVTGASAVRPMYLGGWPAHAGAAIAILLISFLFF